MSIVASFALLHSGTKTPNVNGSRVSKNIISSASVSSLTSESKQTLQVLEPCTCDELCISMSHCSTLNPQFMTKTGLTPGKPKTSTNATEPIKVKRCKYERSGIQYLCCKKPERVTTSTPRPTSFSTATTRPFTFSAPVFTTRITPRPFSAVSNFITHPSVTTYHPTTKPTSNLNAHPSVTTYHPTTKPASLITGVGLRFHSNLHAAQRRELDGRRPNPYGQNEQPIRLISPTTPVPFAQFTFGSTAKLTFRFTTTSTSPSPAFPHGTRFPVRLQNAVPPSLPTSTVSPSTSTRSRPVNFQSKFASTTPIIPTTTNSTPTPFPVRFHNAPTSVSLQNFQTLSAFSRVSATSRVPTTISNVSFDSTPPRLTTTAPTPPTSSTFLKTTPRAIVQTGIIKYPLTTGRPIELVAREKFDFNKLPAKVPLKKELKDEPPIGFVLKGEQLFVPDVLLPSQNYILPSFDFEERTLPTEEPPQEEIENEQTTVESTTTIFRIDFDEIKGNSARERRGT